MIKVKTCFAAEGIMIDKETDQITAFGILEEIRPRSYPLAIQKVAFFCIWQRESTDPQKIRAEFSVSLNGKDIARRPVNVDFQRHLRDRAMIRMKGFVLSDPGTINFRLAIPGYETADYVVRAHPARASGADGAS